jgi:hypothetical protein
VNASASATVGKSNVGGVGNAAAPPSSKNPVLTVPEMDADMRALREKAASIAKMSGPIANSEPVVGGGSDQMASKLRSIAGQVSALARQYDIPLVGDKDAPKGIESFISF